MPYFPAPLHFQHCDCLIDTSRENFSSKEYDRMGEDNLTEFFRGASIVCNGSATVPNEPIELDPTMPVEVTPITQQPMNIKDREKLR